MARRWGNVNFDELRSLRDRVAAFETATSDEFLENVVKALAARLLSLVIRRTPVGQYPDERVGGTLRRGWTVNSQRQAELDTAFGATGGNRITGYVDSLPIEKIGNDYVVTIINPVEYASYVEFGHRTRNHSGWVEGQFMLTISERVLEQRSPQIIEKLFLQQLRRVLNGERI